MALPPRAPENQDQRSLVAATRRREAAQHSAVVASQQRRRANIFTDTPPVETTTLRRHVLQSDFANTGSEPSGSSEAVVSFDGDEIRIYATSAPPSALVTGIVFVTELADLPTPSSSVITLADNVTYFFTTTVDLVGNRLVAGQNTTILGGSSENCRIKSTGLSGAALLTSQYSLPMRNITIEAPSGATALALTAINSTQALDWFGVNFTDTADIGFISSYGNVIWSDCALLNSLGLEFRGATGTVGFQQCIFSGTGGSGSLIKLHSTLNITRRFRIIYSAFVAFGTTVGITVDGSATLPDEGFILDTVNFGGGSTYVSGLTYTSNKAFWLNCRGVTNTAVLSNYYMSGNSTATTISASSTPYKVAGTTTSNAITQRFDNTVASNRAKYTGAFARNVKCSATCTVTGTANDIVVLYFAVDGTVLTESASSVTIEAGGRKESVTVQTLASITTNNYIEVYVENTTASRNVTVESLNVTIEGLN